jgi:hypothetical protein
MKRFSSVIIAFTFVLPAAAYGTEAEYEDVIRLKDGSVFRGTIVEEVPGEMYKIELYGGSVFVFEADEIDIVSRELKERVITSTATEKETVAETRLLFISFRGLFGSIYLREEGLIPFGASFSVGWRAHEVYTPALAVGYLRTEPKDGEHRSVKAHNFVPIYIHNRFTYFRSRSMRIYGEFDVGYGLVYGENEPGQKGGFLYGFGQGLELGSGKIRLGLSAVLYIQPYESGYWGTEPEPLFLAGIGFTI